MRTVDNLFDEAAAACQFPYYFGENWAAFGECLSDLDWLETKRVVIIISKFDELLCDERKAIAPFGRALAGASLEYHRSRGVLEPTKETRGFRVIVNCKNAKLDLPADFIAETEQPDHLHGD